MKEEKQYDSRIKVQYIHKTGQQRGLIKQIRVYYVSHDIPDQNRLGARQSNVSGNILLEG